MPKSVLTEAAKEFVIQALAEFDTPSVVMAAVNKEFGLRVARQTIEKYDPTKRAGQSLAPKWRTLFKAARAAYIENPERLAISYRSVRLRALQRMAEKAEEMRNLALAAQLLEQAAKEMGEVYSRRVEVTGKGGGPIEHKVSAKDLTDDELAAIVASKR